MTTQNQLTQIQIIVTPEGLQEAMDRAVEKAIQKLNLEPSQSKETSLFSRREAAQYLNVSLGTLRTLTATEQIPVVYIGRNPKYRLEDLEGYIDSKK